MITQLEENLWAIHGPRRKPEDGLRVQMPYPGFWLCDMHAVKSYLPYLGCEHIQAVAAFMATQEQVGEQGGLV